MALGKLSVMVAKELSIDSNKEDTGKKAAESGGLFGKLFGKR
jgi:hypothetical protein